MIMGITIEGSKFTAMSSRCENSSMNGRVHGRTRLVQAELDGSR